MQLKTSIDNAATDIDVDVFARMKRVVIFYGLILLSKSVGENHEREIEMMILAKKITREI